MIELTFNATKIIFCSSRRKPAQTKSPRFGMIELTFDATKYGGSGRESALKFPSCHPNLQSVPSTTFPARAQTATSIFPA